MMTDTQFGLPLILPNLTETAVAQRLKRIRFEKGNGTNGYKERWLQELVSRYPVLLPIQQIEPALTNAVSICMELPLPSGFVDNLYATPDGDLIIGETKLFRNPEARREVIGQVIDYAKDLSALSYEGLDAAIRRAEMPDGSRAHPKLTLYQAVASSVTGEELVEERFVDAVSRNLERGRFLLLVIGDGIQLGTEHITAFLQQHAGMHFTFGLVELGVFVLPEESGGGYLVQPRILARTRNIDRGIITIDNGRITAKPPLAGQSTDAPPSLPTTITQEKFYEQLANHDSGVIPRLKAFTKRLEEIAARVEFGKGSMIIRGSRPDETKGWNVGSITTSGEVWTELLNDQANSAGLINLSHDYLKRLASLIPGALVKETAKPIGWYVMKDAKHIMIEDLLVHEDGWLDAIQEFTRAAEDALEE